MRMKMTLNNTVVIDGCDISYWQGYIDFNKMYAAGIRFVIIRAGYGTTIDRNFVTYINAAIAAGLMVGIFWFLYASNTERARSNAKKCEEVIRPYKDHILLGVWADWEYDSDKNAGYMSSAKRSGIVKTFLIQMQEAGYETGIYSNQDYIQSGKFTPELIKEYPLWFAKYSSVMGVYAGRGKDGHPYIWQRTSSGEGGSYGVSSRYLDMNIGYFTVGKELDKENILDKVQSDNSIIKASDNPYPEPKRNLQYREGTYMQSGDDVKWVQWNLWRFGLFLDGNNLPDARQIDSYFGRNSRAATMEAQRRLGLPANGIINQKVVEVFKSV